MDASRPANEKQEPVERAVRPAAEITGRHGGGKKESVLKALRERQAKLQEKEKQVPEQKTQNRKKGEQSI